MGPRLFKSNRALQRLKSSANILTLKFPIRSHRDRRRQKLVIERTTADAYVRPRIAWRGLRNDGRVGANTYDPPAIAAWNGRATSYPAEKLKGIRLDLA